MAKIPPGEFTLRRGRSAFPLRQQIAEHAVAGLELAPRHRFFVFNVGMVGSIIRSSLGGARTG
ncbi:hypothetical protein [Sediminicoccus sp. BL-A-41-H5]|uniref:hypothetical protein n=1 Tax=Sediminicoccus sp. BL-A-41-H5 TaxID=3421106 RepID=UPI003D679E10